MPMVSHAERTSPASPSLPGERIARSRADDGVFRQRDRQEINWTIWDPSVPHIWSRPIERNHRRSCSTSRISRLRSDQRWGAIGHSKVQVISCRSLGPLPLSAYTTSKASSTSANLSRQQATPAAPRKCLSLTNAPY